MKEYIRVNQACYDDLAEEYGDRADNKSSSEESESNLCKFILNTVTLPDDALVLEIGPGAGKILQCFSDLGFYTMGVELSAKMAELAHKSSPKSPIIIGDILKIDFVESQFDIIYLGALIHLFPQEDAMLLMRKVSHWLKPTGRVFVNTTCNDKNQEGFYEKKDYHGQCRRFRRRWTESCFNDFVIASGFLVLDTMYTDEHDRGKRWVAYVCKKA